ncbi:MAG: hypothetical protein KIT14_23775 [bacterium]|nr:hypothetical protein [bacterium]
MRRSWLVALLFAVSLVPAHAASVRIFAVGNAQRLDDALTYQSFRDKMAALMDAAHPQRASLVQAGVDDVASHLRAVDPLAPEHALVVFPESVGLIAAFIGSRGAGARLQASAPLAIASLFEPYGAQVAHYQAKYPGQPPVRYLVLALTDTLHRAFTETFRELAVAHGVHIAACADLAPARRIDAAADPALVDLLRDPDEPERTYAYEATSARPVNSTYVFAPDGAILVPDGHGGTLRAPAETGGVIRGSTDKAYLTPIEQPPPGEPLGLALGAGPVRDLEVLDTPVGRLAIVISKDAWMPDVNARFAAKGANLILQPEAFSSWAYDTAEWSPDVFKEGGFANLQRNPGWAANVNASLTGNLLDITFDGQSAILGRRTKTLPGPLGAENAWIGQNPDTGFRAIAPWIVPDPGLGDPSLTLAQRRAQLAAQGAHLLPGSGIPCPGPRVPGACENGYREAVVWHDVTLPDGDGTGAVDATRETPPHFSASVRVTSAGGPARRAPRVATRGKRVFVVWHEASAGELPNVFLAVGKHGGARFGAPIRVSGNARGSVHETFPAIAVRGKRVAVVWQEFADGRSDDRGRIMLRWLDARGRAKGAAVRVDDDDTAGKWLPAIAFAGTTPVVTWIDERDPGPEGEAFEHVYVARAVANDRFAPAVRVDQGAPVPLSTHQDNKWAPTIAAAGRQVWIAWVDFRSNNWDVYLARSDDAGATFGANVRLDDFPAYERIHDTPSVVADGQGRVVVGWTDVRAREADPNLFAAVSTDAGATFAANVQIDDSRVDFDPNRDTPTSQWLPSLALAKGTVFAAWQDDRLGNADVFFARSTDGGTTWGASERVDDTGTGPSHQSRPSLALAGRGKQRRCLVAWEDDRDGTTGVYLARRACGR